MKRMRPMHIIVLLLIALVLSCSEEPTDSLYNPDRDPGTAPVISNILPEDSALAGVGTLTITGNGFSPVAAENFVIFDDIVAEVTSASETELTVKTPKTAKDRFRVRVGIRSSEFYSDSVFYKLNPAVAEFGTLAPGEVVLAVAVNRAGTVFKYIQGKILRKTIPGQSTKLINGNMAFELVEAMQIGPNDELYASVTIRNGQIVKLDTTSGSFSSFASFRGIPRDFDFDGSLYIYAAIDSSYTQGTQVIAAGNITSIMPDGSSSAVVQSFDRPVSSLRVFNNTLYFTLRHPDSSDASALYKGTIDGNGGLSSVAPVLTAEQSSILNQARINDITISEDGRIFIGTSAEPDAIYVFDETSQTLDIHYPELIGPEIIDFHWGTGLYLYAAQKTSSSSSKVLRIDMRENGAPYYGRD